MPQRDDDLVVLTTATSEMQAGLFISVLDSQGIDAVGPSTAATTLRWEVGASDPYRVYVRRADLARAREALSRERADSVDIDWSEVDVGDPTPEQAAQAQPSSAGGRFPWQWLVLGFLLVGMLVFQVLG